jgi:predicted nuclease of predicted toxin-antitoxin system
MAWLPADENIHPSLIERPRSKGHDIAGVIELGLMGQPDETVLKAANEQGRLLVTADKDFGLILESGPLSGQGRVLLLRYQVLNWDRIAQDVAASIERVGHEYANDPRLLVVLSEGQCRTRHAT